MQPSVDMQPPYLGLQISLFNGIVLCFNCVKVGSHPEVELITMIHLSRLESVD